MRFASTIGLTAALLLGLAPPAAGQDLDAACEAIAGSSIGAWTEHAIESPNGAFDVTFALVESRGATWYEVRSQTSAGRSILQLRVPGFPFTPDEIEEVVTKTGASPAVRLPDSMVRQYASAEQGGPLGDIRAHCREAQVVGMEEVTVPAGTFVATHLRFPASGGDVWVSDAVPFGIVKGRLPGQGDVELRAHGTDATASITETPISMGEGGASTDAGQ
ncbi:MAG: hypothetical protein ACODAB_09410 [Gemmatimonadota bacterium]